MNISDIQAALRDKGLDGWLFFDHHQRDPLAYRVLGLSTDSHVTRRWYYLIPANGEPKGLVHKIESHVLDGLPGTFRSYSRWTQQQDELKTLLGGLKRVAMDYSENCAIPYVAMVDAGTVELVRSCGVDVVASADLIQQFESPWTPAQLESHLAAGRKMDQLRARAFQLISQRLADSTAIDEYEVQQFLMKSYAENGLTTDHPPIVAVNAHASDPHYAPDRDRTAPIRKGDNVLIDMWAKSNEPGSTFYDITWVGYCGSTVPDEVNNVFDVVRGGRDAGVDLVTKSVANRRALKGFEVDDVVRNYIAERGFGDYFIHRTGHSIGVEVHGTSANIDNFETHDTRAIIPWTCFSIEPGVYLPNFGIRSELNVFVGEEGARVTGETQTEVLKLA